MVYGLGLLLEKMGIRNVYRIYNIQQLTLYHPDQVDLLYSLPRQKPLVQHRQKSLLKTVKLSSFQCFHHIYRVEQCFLSRT